MERLALNSTTNLCNMSSVNCSNIFLVMPEGPGALLLVFFRMALSSSEVIGFVSHRVRFCLGQL